MKNTKFEVGNNYTKPGDGTTLFLGKISNGIAYLMPSRKITGETIKEEDEVYIVSGPVANLEGVLEGFVLVEDKELQTKASELFATVDLEPEAEIRIVK